MKKTILLVALAMLYFSCSQESNIEIPLKSKEFSTAQPLLRLPPKEPCPPGTFETWSYDFDYIALHRASTGCASRFSICVSGHWVRDCAPNFPGKLSGYDPITEKVSVVGVLSSDKDSMELHFPIELKSLPTFTNDDFDTFGFDSDYALDEKITIKAGEYVPFYTKNEIIVTVKLL